jgi:hypothetical protein
MISHFMFLHVSVRKGPSSGNKMKVIQHKTNQTVSCRDDVVYNSHTFKMQAFFIQLLYKCDES